LDALRAGSTQYGYVEAWRGGFQLSFTDADGFTSTRLPLNEKATNQVVNDSTTPGPRRTLSVTLAPLPGLWDLLAPLGTELRAYTVMRFLDGSLEVIPQGVFGIDVQKVNFGGGGDLTLTAPDRWQQIVNAEFLTPRAADAGVSVRVQIATLINEVFPGAGVVDTATSMVTTPAQTWDRDRAKAILDLAKSASLDVGFDRTGTPYIRDLPTLADRAVWTVDASANGVLMTADRERNRQSTYNMVKVSSPANPAGGDLFAPVFVWDNNPASPTYAGSGSGSDTAPPALSTAGPFGQRCYFYSSPLVTTSAQAASAGASWLAKLSGLAAQLTLTAAPNPALDDGDTILVVLPPDDPSMTADGGVGVGTEPFGTSPFGVGYLTDATTFHYTNPQPTERHIVDKVTVSLTPQNSQSIDTRSTAADLSGS
jgi:hypothetical protein